MKLILSILTMIPILGAILYLYMEKDIKQQEKLIVLISLIPFVNFVCAVILILNALEIVKLN